MQMAQRRLEAARNTPRARSDSDRFGRGWYGRRLRLVSSTMKSSLHLILLPTSASSPPSFSKISPSFAVLSLSERLLHFSPLGPQKWNSAESLSFGRPPTHSTFFHPLLVNPLHHNGVQQPQGAEAPGARCCRSTRSSSCGFGRCRRLAASAQVVFIANDAEHQRREWQPQPRRPPGRRVAVWKGYDRSKRGSVGSVRTSPLAASRRWLAPTA